MSLKDLCIIHDALARVVHTPAISGFLSISDPKVLEQIQNALDVIKADMWLKLGYNPYG
jgi:hypothetical protein